MYGIPIRRDAGWNYAFWKILMKCQETMAGVERGYRMPRHAEPDARLSSVSKGPNIGSAGSGTRHTLGNTLFSHCLKRSQQ
jgi:hypothetical protein